MFFLGLLLGAFLGAMSVLIHKSNLLGDDDNESSGDGAIPKNPKIVLAQAAGAAKARGGY